MSRAGFVYNGRPFDKRSPYSLASWVGLTKADDARFGYQSLIPASPQIADEALGAPADSDGKAAFFEALLGVNRDGVVPSADGSPVPLREGGCEAAARDAIYDDYDEWVGLNYSVQQLRSQAVLATESDSSYQDANRKWANCMRSAGYDFDAPAEALAAYLGEPGRATATSATEDEVRAATKDVACKTQIDYEDHVMLTLSKYETDIYESNQEVVDEYGRKQDQALSNAAAAAD